MCADKSNCSGSAIYFTDTNDILLNKNHINKLTKKKFDYHCYIFNKFIFIQIVE